MADYTWSLQGTTPTTIAATDILQFAGATFDSAITVGEYNDSTHVETNTATNKSSGNSPHNTKYLTSSTVSLNGAASANVSTISTANCPLKINFAHSTAVAVSGHTIYAYNGTTTTTGPTDVTFYIAEQGAANWTAASGSASALAVTNSASSTSHDFFFLVSASPTSVGEKTAFAIRSELTYS
jgi:hypothetical protein